MVSLKHALNARKVETNVRKVKNDARKVESCRTYRFL